MVLSLITFKLITSVSTTEKGQVLQLQNPLQFWSLERSSEEQSFVKCVWVELTDST